MTDLGAIRPPVAALAGMPAASGQQRSPLRIGLVLEGPIAFENGTYSLAEGEGLYIDSIARRFSQVVIFAYVLRRGNQLFEDFRSYPLTSPNISVVEFPLHGSDRFALGRKVKQIIHTVRLLWSHRKSVDLFYVFMPGYSGALSTLMCRLARIPYFLYLASDWPEEAELLIPLRGAPAQMALPIYRRLVSALQDAAVAGARFVIVAGRLLARKYEGGRRPIVETIPRLNWSAYDVHDRDDTCGGRQITLLFVGYLIARKGSIDFVDAIAILRERGRDVRGVIVGSGDEEDMLRQRVAAKEVADAIELKGLISSGTAVAERYQQSDMFVFASYAGEGFPRVLYEAMSQGLPIVSTDVCGISLKLQPNRHALFVPPRNPAAIADAVEYILDNHEFRRNLIQNGQQFMTDLRKIADGGRQVYDLVSTHFSDLEFTFSQENARKGALKMASQAETPAVRWLYSIVSRLKRFPFFWRTLSDLYYRFVPSQRVLLDVHGHKIWADTKDRGIGQRLYLSGDYGAARIAWIRDRLKPGDVAIDVGANIGFFTLEMARCVGPTGKVIAVEPDERNYRTLCENIKENGYDNIILPHMKAVADENKKATFYRTSSQTDNSLKPEPGAEAVEIEIVTLDRLLGELGIDRANFMKIDTDGSEPLAIIGMANTLQRSPDFQMIAEFTPVNLRRYFSDPLEFLRIASSHGLTLRTIMDTETGPLKDQSIACLSTLAEEENYDLVFEKS